MNFVYRSCRAPARQSSPRPPTRSPDPAKVAVFAEGAKAVEAKAAGAFRVGGEDLIEEIKNGNIDCTRYIATPNMMPMVSKIAKILGPRGLMPNPKQGTMTMDVKTAIKNAQAGEVQFRTDARGLTV